MKLQFHIHWHSMPHNFNAWQKGKKKKEEHDFKSAAQVAMREVKLEIQPNLRIQAISYR